MCESEPDKAWETIQEIIGRDHSDEILANIGAGPFEDLMGNVLEPTRDLSECWELYGRTRFPMMCGFGFRISRRPLGNPAW
jgi:hypothetical protein